MAVIEIVAGPPGIGKSTTSKKIVTKGYDVLDHDLLAYEYQKKGWKDAASIANMKLNNQIRDYLIANKSFAIELNLGFQEHYDFVRKLKYFNNENVVDVKLYYTNKVKLCLDRAEQRFLSGRHLVEPNVINEMYDNTFPLLEFNFALVDKLSLINVAENSIRKILIFDKQKQKTDLKNDLPDWVQRVNILPFLEKQMNISNKIKLKTGFRK